MFIGKEMQKMCEMYKKGEQIQLKIDLISELKITKMIDLNCSGGKWSFKYQFYFIMLFVLVFIE